MKKNTNLTDSRTHRQDPSHPIMATTPGAPRNVVDPTLWNSPIGRRDFLQSVGKASAVTAIASTGLLFEVAYASSAMVDRLTELRTTFGTNMPTGVTGNGGAYSVAQAIGGALTDLAVKLQNGGYLTDYSPTYSSVPSNYVITNVLVYWDPAGEVLVPYTTLNGFTTTTANLGSGQTGPKTLRIVYQYGPP
jgi:hypothetical protein